MGTEAIVLELNKYYMCDKSKYQEECDYWKSRGYKIYRDSKGRHKVVEPPKQNNTDINNVFGDVFGDIFGQVFSGKSSD